MGMQATTAAIKPLLFNGLNRLALFAGHPYRTHAGRRRTPHRSPAASLKMKSLLGTFCCFFRFYKYKSIILKEAAHMKKYIIFALALACILHIGIAGCQKTTSGSDIYAFPERTAQIKCTVYSQGAEKEFVLGSDEHNPHGLSVMPVIAWYYGLKLISCDKPEDVGGAEHYTFTVNGASVFSYEDRGSEAYIIVSDTWYKVNNPSAPPLAND